MSVSGIRPYEGFYQYNSIKKDEIPDLQTAGVEDVQAASAEPEAAGLAADAGQNFDSYDYAQRYQQDEAFALKGIDSDINGLDVEKAVSDLDKDKILQQYQYFVGHDTAKPAAEGAASGIHRSGENFSL